MKFNKVVVSSMLGLSLFSCYVPTIKADSASNIERVATKSQRSNENEIVDNNVVMLDVARRKMNKNQIESCLKAIDSQKFQFVQLHLSDNENFAVKSNILHNQDAEDTLSIDDLKEIVQYANNKGIQIIPDIDVPAHCEGIINDLENCDSKWLNHNIVMNNETLDYTNPDTLNFVKQLYAEILPVFANQKNPYVVIGADEVAGNQANASSFAYFLNELDNYCNRKGFNTIVWNDCLNKDVLNELNTNITVDYWNNDSDCNTSARDIANHGNPVKNSYYGNSYYNTLDLNNSELRQEKSSRLASERNSKMLALWGSDDEREQTISNNKVISYIQQVQNKLD